MSDKETQKSQNAESNRIVSEAAASPAAYFSNGVDADSLIHKNHERGQHPKPAASPHSPPPPPSSSLPPLPRLRMPASGPKEGVPPPGRLGPSPVAWRDFKKSKEGICKKEEPDDWKSCCIIEITDEEVNSYITGSVKEKLTSLDDDSAMSSRQPKIQKVPFLLSENTKFKKYYEPRMISIGPYHHNSPNLTMMEKLKLQIAKHFIQKHSLGKEVIYSKIKKNIKILKMFYEEEAIKNFDDDKLAWMFFLDGCTLLYYIYFATEDKDKGQYKRLNLKPDCLTFVIQHDFFLLENQLPFEVLMLIISCSSKEDERSKFRNSIQEFIFYSIKAQWNSYEKPDYQLRQMKAPAHLLDLLRTRMLESGDTKPSSYSMVRYPIRSLVGFISNPLEKIKDVIEYMGKRLENFPTKQVKDLQFFRNVEELKAAGIRLRPNNRGCVTDISFDLGTLNIHPIKVDDTTVSILLNLMAYEMSSNFSNDFGISSYIAFLDSLIDRSQDVKELRDRQILRNILGSDEIVANLFNEISNNVVPNPYKYSDVKINIQRRYKNKWMTWIAQFSHLYFQSPWSVIAFVAAIIVLALTIIQTIYTALGYYK